MIKGLFKKGIVFLLEKEARIVLRKYQPKVVAITGSVGKTSTKDSIYTALSKFYFVRKSYKNFNTEVGVPITILDVPTGGSSPVEWLKNLLEGLKLAFLPSLYPDWLVLEVGADHKGDIREIGNWLKPDVVVITRLSEVPVHVENFESPEELYEEKGELVKALKPDGTLILNAEDEMVLSYRNLTSAKVILYGDSKESNLKAKDYEVVYTEDGRPKGITFTVESGDPTSPKATTGKENIPVFLGGTLGKHHVQHILASFAVCKSAGEHLSVVGNSFKNHEPTAGRMRILEGKSNTTIIDDTYNSSPIAVFEALNSLRGLKNNKRNIVVLGDMLELGKYSIDEHKKAGEQVQKVADVLCTVGVRSKFMVEGALGAGMKEKNIHEFGNSVEAGEFLKDFIKTGDVVLVKGSQGMRMEKVVEALMAHPEDKEKLLVRQDAEWRNR